MRDGQVPPRARIPVNAPGCEEVGAEVALRKPETPILRYASCDIAGSRTRRRDPLQRVVAGSRTATLERYGPKVGLAAGTR